MAEVIVAIIGYWSQGGVSPRKPMKNGYLIPHGESPWERAIREFSSEGQMAMILKDSPEPGECIHLLLEASTLLYVNMYVCTYTESSNIQLIKCGNGEHSDYGVIRILWVFLKLLYLSCLHPYWIQLNS
jgi:hypothetical protein